MQKPLDTRLNANLPEDWELNDVITHDGISGNRGEQRYGYNYQSKQVNEAHKAINAINDAFEGAQENLEKIATDTTIADGDTVPVVKTDNTKRRLSFTALINAIKTKFNLVYAALSHSHGNISNEGNLGTTANQAAYTTTGGKLTAGTLPVAAGGTGKSTLTAGQVLVGNGAGAVAQKTIDTTQGGTANSDSLITSGAVRAALNAGDVASAPKLATPRKIALTGAVTSTATNFDGSADINIPTTSVDATKLTGQAPVANGGTGVPDLNVGKLRRGTTSDSIWQIYLSPSGNDNNAGLTAEQPMKSIRAAVGRYGGLNRLQLNLAAGTYTDSAEVVISGNMYTAIVGIPTTPGSVVITHPIIFQSSDAKFHRIAFDLSTSTTTYPAITLRQSKYDIQECVFKGKADVHAGINVSLGSSGYIASCAFQSGIRGVEIGSGASMTALTCTIANTFEIGFNVNGGTLISGGNTNSARTQFTMYNSAVIFNDGILLNQASNVVATAELV